MKTSSKLTLGVACATICLVLGACGDSNVPASKDVQVKPPAATPADAPGAKFKGSFGSNNTPGAPAGDAPKPADGN
jgi:hypothetical protein